MRRWMVALVGGWLLACSGAGPYVPVDGAPLEPEDEGDDDDGAEADDDPVEAKDPLPDVVPDDEERDELCMPESYEDWDPLLAEEQPDGGPVEVDAGKNRIVETVVMRNGLMVRVTRGGCTHTGETWELSPAPKGPVKKVFRKVMSHVELASDDPTGAARCLEAMPDPPPKDGWDGGDAVSCSYSREGKVLSLVYDFAM